MSIAAILLAGISIAGNPEVDFRDESAAKKHFAAKQSGGSTWSQGAGARGSTTSKCGTVIALPTSGWLEKQTFTYYGPGYKVLKGRLVTVGVKVYIPNTGKIQNEAPRGCCRRQGRCGVSVPNTGRIQNDEQCRNVVKNLAESGMAIPRSAGKPGHIQALRLLAKRRFGASSAMVVYDGCENNELKFVLFNCKEKDENPNIRTVMFDGETPSPDDKTPKE